MPLLCPATLGTGALVASSVVFDFCLSHCQAAVSQSILTGTSYAKRRALRIEFE